MNNEKTVNFAEIIIKGLKMLVKGAWAAFKMFIAAMWSLFRFI